MWLNNYVRDHEVGTAFPISWPKLFILQLCRFILLYLNNYVRDHEVETAFPISWPKLFMYKVVN